MPRVRELIERLFPQGTNPADGDVRVFPTWPPDAFAAAATVVKMSGCYTRPWPSGAADSGAGSAALSGGNPFAPAFLARAREIGRIWSTLPADPVRSLPEVQALWNTLIDPAHGRVWERNAPLGGWEDAALRLLIIADEACRGVGFITSTAGEPMSPVAREVLNAYIRQKSRSGLVSAAPLAERGMSLPFLPTSLCRMIWPDELCVQPKTLGSRVGCTVRSLSRNVALLPPGGQVRTSWEYAVNLLSTEPQRPLNLLLVPFPYDIPDGSFHCCGLRRPEEGLAAGGRPDGSGSYFDVIPTWLTRLGKRLKDETITEFLVALIGQAERNLHARVPERSGDACRVHGLVLPELALDRPTARAVARGLAERTNLEVFITGASAHDGQGPPRNVVLTSIFHAGTEIHCWEQAKHHGWRIDGPQNNLYNLSLAAHDSAGPGAVFWERINVEDRHCAFWLLRPRLSVAALICEDLARLEPVQTAVRSVGPSLVIALLMDGAQIPGRWPNQYAGVLADDPGSAVLTFTSSGLMRRSIFHGLPHYVALWREPNSKPLSLELERGSHAVLLELSEHLVPTRGLDGSAEGELVATLVYTHHSQVTLAERTSTIESILR